MKFITKDYRAEIWFTNNWHINIYENKFELHGYEYCVITGFGYAQELWGVQNTIHMVDLDQDIDL